MSLNKSWIDFVSKFKTTKPQKDNKPMAILASDEEMAKENPVDGTAEDEVRKILVDHPQISGPTLLNTIQSKGMKVVKESWKKAFKENNFDKELAQGIKVEMEHTDDKNVAKKIALDHLAENPLYYSKLKKMKLSWHEKASGVFKFKDTKPQEADSASANVASVRSGANETLESKHVEKSVNIREGNLDFRTKFIESSGRDNGVGYSKFKVVLIQEGLGNFSDAYFYSKQAIESAIPVFEGKKIYADHPTSIEESTRPERSVKDVLGHFENVQVIESDDGQAQLVGDVIIMQEEPYRWARALMAHSVEYAKKYPDKDFVGLSINASGDAEEISLDKLLEQNLPDMVKVKLNKAKEKNIQSVKLVSAIKEAISCDLVTEAGAGGKVLEMLEKENTMAKKKVKESEAKENEAKETKESKDVAPAKGEGAEKDPSKLHAESEGDQAAEEPHTDEEQDKALIKKMIAEYLGAEEEDNEEVMEMCKEAYEAYLEMGYKEDEAMKQAGHAMKLAKHMAKKESKGAESEVEKEEKEKVEEAEGMDKKESSSAPETEDAPPKHKESAELIKLQAEVMALKEKLSAIEVEKHLETVLKESGLRREATAGFKTQLGTPKSTKEIDEKFKIFVEAYNAAKGSETNSLPFIVTTEKRTEQKAPMSFADCLK